MIVRKVIIELKFRFVISTSDFSITMNYCSITISPNTILRIRMIKAVEQGKNGFRRIPEFLIPQGTIITDQLKALVQFR